MMFTHHAVFFYQTITKEFPSDTYIMLSGYCGLYYEKKMKIAFNDGRQALKIVNLVKVHSWKIWYILAGDMVARVSMKTLPPRDTNLP